MGFTESVALPPALRGSAGKFPIPVKLPPWVEPFQAYRVKVSPELGEAVILL
jgi:hypothetical protein